MDTLVKAVYVILILDSRQISTWVVVLTKLNTRKQQLIRYIFNDCYGSIRMYH